MVKNKYMKKGFMDKQILETPLRTYKLFIYIIIIMKNKIFIIFYKLFSKVINIFFKSLINIIN